MLAAVARTELPVLIVGQTGAGKEDAARWLHDHSPRSDGPFVTLPCNAIPEERFEAECLGHLEGAFTGAVRDHVGYIGQANQGTLFLDEIDKLSPLHQRKILQPLEGRYRRVGSKREERSDFRIVSATNQNLYAMYTQGRFLFDLYGRIIHIEVRLPDVRERPEDVAATARRSALHELRTDSPDREERARTIAEAARDLCAHPEAWPLGFRGVHHFAGRAVLFGVDTAVSQLRTNWLACGKDEVHRAQSSASSANASSAGTRPVRPTPNRGTTPSAQPSTGRRGIPIESLAGLICSILHNPDASKQPVGGRSEDALAIARLLASADEVSRHEFENLSTWKSRAVKKALTRLVDAAVITHSGDRIALRWPLVDVYLFALPSDAGGEATSTPLPPRIPVRVATGQRFGVQVRSHLPVVLDIALMTHVAVGTGNQAANPARSLLVAAQELELGRDTWHEFELQEPGGFEQLLVHLTWPGARRGARMVTPSQAPIAMPSPTDLERGRKQARLSPGPGWLTEYWLIHS